MTLENHQDTPNDAATPDADPMEQRNDDPTDPERVLPGDRPAESREPGYQDIDDRDGM